MGIKGLIGALVLAAAVWRPGFAAVPERLPDVPETAGHEYKVGLPDRHVPFSYYAATYRRHDGFAVRTAGLLCKELKAKCSFEFMSYQSMTSRLSSGELDFALGAFSPDDYLRKGGYTYSTQVMSARPVMVSSNAGIVFYSSRDMQVLNIGARFGSPEELALMHGRDRGQVAFLTSYGAYDDLARAVEKGKVDCIYVDSLSAYGLMMKAKVPLYMADDLISPAPRRISYRVAVKKGDRDLLSGINQGLRKLRQNKELYRLAVDFFPYQDTEL